MIVKNRLRFLKITYWLRRFYISKITRLFLPERFLRKSTFKYIYLSSHWQYNFKIDKNRSLSGPGSNLDYTGDLTYELLNFFQKNSVRKILDIGCGDFIWMNLLLKKYDEYREYLGLDIVDELIKKNNEKFSSNKVIFKSFDLVEDKIPEGFDIVLVRDVFIHLKNHQILNFIDKLKKTNIKYLGVTTTPGLKKNIELKTEGRFRYINVEIEPYNLRKFFFRIKEKNELDFLNIYILNK